MVIAHVALLSESIGQLFVLRRAPRWLVGGPRRRADVSECGSVQSLKSRSESLQLIEKVVELIGCAEEGKESLVPNRTGAFLVQCPAVSIPLSPIVDVHV